MKKQNGGNFNARGSVREANRKRPHAVWFQLYDILEKAKTQTWWKDPWSPGLGGRDGEQGKPRGFLGQRNTPCDIMCHITTFWSAHRM